jgi:hypothetical protein
MTQIMSRGRLAKEADNKGSNHSRNHKHKHNNNNKYNKYHRQSQDLYGGE